MIYLMDEFHPEHLQDVYHFPFWSYSTGQDLGVIPNCFTL
jgi:hypothetical protein